jgi:hypothetical protein
VADNCGDLVVIALASAVMVPVYFLTLLHFFRQLNHLLCAFYLFSISLSAESLPNIMLFFPIHAR